MRFFDSALSSAYVCSGVGAGSPPSYACAFGSKIGSQPKALGPRAATIEPGVQPSKRCTSESGPGQKAKTVRATADLSSYAASILFSPTWPSFARKNLMYLRERASGPACADG